MTDQRTVSVKTFWISIFALASLLGIVFNKTDTLDTKLNAYQNTVSEKLTIQSVDLAELKTDSKWIIQTLKTFESINN